MIRLVVLLGILPFFLNAQNLVFNNSFECGENRCDPTVFASDLGQNACGWSCPQRGTTDVFSTKILNKACFCSMPYNGTDTNDGTAHVGSEMPRSGNRFAGIYTYGLTLAKDTSYREYLQTKLIEPLIPGQNYCGKMYVSRAEHLKYASNNLGMHFSDQLLNIGSYAGPVHLDPLVIQKDIITEAEGWVAIAGTFKVPDTVQYMIIGNFSYNYETSIVLKEGPVQLRENYNYAYYFVDDVSVTKLTIPELSFSGSTTICRGDYARIEALGDWDEVRWTTLPDTATIVSSSRFLYLLPDETTSYLVRTKICESIVKDTVSITVLPKPTFELGGDTTICRESSFQLDAGPNRSRILWQDQSTERFLTVKGPGRYYATVANEFGCETRDEINISVTDRPFVNLGNDTTVCKLFPLTVGNDASEILWSTGSTDSIFYPAAAGQYWVLLGNRCGEASDTINIFSSSDVFIPNVFTPNSDPFNETFMIEGPTPNIFPALSIYNRWGQTIFSDPTYKGDWPKPPHIPEPGAYFYVLRFPSCEPYKGWLQVMK
jgi:hypothetical protein